VSIGTQTDRTSLKQVFALAASQHNVVTRAQLLELGVSSAAVKHRIRRGRLHSVHPGIYVVGSPRLTRHGGWMAAVLACGPNAVLSYESAAALWGIRDLERGRIEVSVPPGARRRRKGIVVHRRDFSDGDLTRRAGIPVTSPTCTLIDLASRIRPGELEAAISEADRLDLVDPERLRQAVDRVSHRPGLPALRRVLDRRTFRVTHSELERLFLPIARQAGLPPPETQVWFGRFRVDFYWPELGLVVETDSLRYHRTATQQQRDRVRDQAHLAAGRIPLRFTHAQVKFEPDYVRETLAAVARKLA
jgi:very-short-patch-repair endonuclease/predicted transcriptional regulator of viral defense system